jgi:DSBA-like thioredoxin domain
MDRPFTLFSDFNCPFCYALHERLHELHLLDRCAWQGVQHAPHLPTPMRPWQGTLDAELRHEVSVVHRISPDLPLKLPLGKPNTANAIACAVGILSREREAGMIFVRKIYQAFWVEGRDISDQGVLADLAGSTLSHISDDTRTGIAQRWNEEWQTTEQPVVPLIVGPSGDLLAGCIPVGEIKKFFTDHS